ncbi:MAG: tetratricopeptide repeat protein [Verrucomicrobiota bacterium]
MSQAVKKISRNLGLGGAALIVAVIALLVVRRHNRTEPAAFATYAGSASCRDCHQTAYTEWQKSNHGLAERQLNPVMDQTAFPAGKFQVTARGPGATNAAFAVARVIGNDPLRQFLVPFPGSRYQTLEASFDPHATEWFNVYGTEDRQPGEWGHWTGRGMNWNNMCAACHNTRLRKNYDERTDSYATTMAEMSVGCEACHGPMKNHVVWQKAHPNQERDDDPTLRNFTPTQMLETCAQCHSRRGELTGNFAPGDLFDDHHLLTIVDETDLYYPDGQVRDEDYEYAAFLGSKMHAKGIRCGDCHQPHTAKVKLAGNLLCLRCHDGSNTNAPTIDPVKHSFHKVDPLYFDPDGIDLLALGKRSSVAVITNGGECVNCHMPQTVYMQRHRRHDHGFTSPDPLLTKQAGIPNACNQCHADKTVDWALSWTEKWYGDKMNRPSRSRALTIASARRGDPAARDGLLALLVTNGPPYWNAVAARLLENWAGDPTINAALTGAATHTNALVRANVARSLRDETVLRRLLADPVRSVRFHAAWALRANLPDDAELRAMVDFMADQPQGQMQKGALAVARGDAPAAVAHYQKAVDWDANSAPIRHDYAVVLSSIGSNAAAIAQLEAACRLDPRDAEYPYKLALAWNELGKIDKTIEQLQIAVRLDANHARAWYNLGLALNSVGRVSDALAALKRAEMVNPADPRAPYAAATILARLGRMDEARAAAQRALRIQPGYAPAQEFLQSLR